MDVHRLTAVVVIVGMTMMILGGCASIVSKSNWPVTITSNPSGANVTVKDSKGVAIHSGTTPMTVTLPSGRGFFKAAAYEVSFDKDGYAPTVTTTSSNINGWYFGNILLGGWIGMLIVDPATGAMWRLNPMITGSMSPVPNAAPAEVNPKITNQQGPAEIVPIKGEDKPIPLTQ